MEEDIVRVLRIIEYVGPRDWVEGLVAQAVTERKLNSPTKGTLIIRGATLGIYPEILKQKVNE